MTRPVLFGLLLVWMILCRPNLEEQVATTRQARAALASLSWEDRTAALDQPGHRVAAQIARFVPANACVLILSYTGPEHIRYYQSRFAYYLYPRRVMFSDQSDAAAERCPFVAVFRDTGASLAQDPFRGRWDETQLARRIASRKKIFSGEQVEIFQ